MSGQSIQVNEFVVERVEVTANSANRDLVVLQVTERADGGHTTDSRFVMNRELWQRVADQLALLGLAPTVTGVEAYSCERCGARFGIAGRDSGSDEDRAANDQYLADVEFHATGLCTPGEVPC